MYLSLETSISIIRTGKPIGVELVDLVSYDIVFLSQTTSQRLLIFLSGSLIIPVKAKMFAEMFSENSDLDNSGTSISVFSCRSDQKLYNVPTTSKMVKKCLITFKSRTCFADCWKVSSVFQECKNVRDSSVAKNYCLVCLRCVAGKIFDKLLIEKHVDYLEKCDLFSLYFIWFQIVMFRCLYFESCIYGVVSAFNRCVCNMERGETIWTVAVN